MPTRKRFIIDLVIFTVICAGLSTHQFYTGNILNGVVWFVATLFLGECWIIRIKEQKKLTNK